MLPFSLRRYIRSKYSTCSESSSIAEPQSRRHAEQRAAGASTAIRQFLAVEVRVAAFSGVDRPLERRAAQATWAAAWDRPRVRADAAGAPDIRAPCALGATTGQEAATGDSSSAPMVVMRTARTVRAHP